MKRGLDASQRAIREYQREMGKPSRCSSLGKVEDFNLYLYLETATKIPSYRREAEPVRCVLDAATMSRSLR